MNYRIKITPFYLIVSRIPYIIPRKRYIIARKRVSRIVSRHNPRPASTPSATRRNAHSARSFAGKSAPDKIISDPPQINLALPGAFTIFVEDRRRSGQFQPTDDRSGRAVHSRTSPRTQTGSRKFSTTGSTACKRSLPNVADEDRCSKSSLAYRPPFLIFANSKSTPKNIQYEHRTQ